MTNQTPYHTEQKHPALPSTPGTDITVDPMQPVIHRDESDILDPSLVKMPDEAQLREIERKTGITVQADSAGMRITANDPKNTVGEQTQPTPNGTDPTHKANESGQEEVQRNQNDDVISQLICDVKEDSAAVLEDKALTALAILRKQNPAEYQRKRAQFKRINSKVSLTDMDRAVNVRISEDESAQTHHGYAKALLSELTTGMHAPVGHLGGLFVVNPETNIWDAIDVDTLIKRVAELHDGKEHCSRAADYRAIALHAIALASDGANTFFDDAPLGIACAAGFYWIDKEQIDKGPLKPEHRQRLMLEFTPENMPTPMFDKFLHETFESEHEGEEAQQIQLVQEIAGGIMLGILPKHQIAILFYEPFGRAGKGTLERFLRQLVPKEFVTAISPFKWGQDYHAVTLAGKRLNVVGELPENDPIPASSFKSVIGGDLVTGRHPTHRPITFTNEATHLFMSNHLITTKDQSEAFFARWKIVDFPNSRLRSGLPIDKDLAQRIIDNELPGIAYWALEGAARLLRNGKLSESTAHDRLMAKWRCTANSLEEFIHECCELAPDSSYRRSEFYSDYIDWCSENGRKPFAKSRVRDLLEHNIGKGVRLVENNGHETFKGIRAKPHASGSKPRDRMDVLLRVGNHDARHGSPAGGDDFLEY